MKNFLKKNWHKLVLLTYALFVPVTRLCADFTVGTKLDNPLSAKGINNVPDFIKNLLTGVLRVGIPIVALAIIYCGFLFVEARGNTEKLTKAKDALLYTLIGAAILLGSWAIAQMISNTVLAL